MILIDYSQTAISNLHQQIKNDARHKLEQNLNPDEKAQAGVVNPDDLRHMILNSIRKVNRDFGREYGQIVLCTDNANYWRKGEFRYYKAHRKKDREDSGIDWTLVFKTLNELRSDLKETFPYKVMDVSLAEADDVIGVICKHFHTREKIIILSGDHDFMQLQRYPGICQYSPTINQYLHTDDPAAFLKEHIIRGDRGDGIPNFLSSDDTIVTGTRQTSIFEVKLEAWLGQEPEEFCGEQTLKNYYRNQKLVDLSQIPEAIETAILEEFDRPILGHRNKIYGYLVKHRMKLLLSLSRDF